MGLLLALCLIAGGVMPGYASAPPDVPHYFSGSVSFNADPVEEGTLVKAFVDDIEAAWTTVDDQSRYSLGVPGTAGAAEVTFEVGGVPANETATWQSGKVQELNLTIDETPEPPLPRYALTMTEDPAVGGNATDETGKSPYAAGIEVNIKAIANPGYSFVGWTANTTATFGNATAAETTFTMPAQAVTVTAHFEAAYNLSMAADPVGGGDALDVDGKGAYAAGTTVRIKAQPKAGYGFINWTADAPVTFHDATAEETAFTMPDHAVTVTAHFGVAYNLTMAVDPVGGGNATDVGAKGAYAAGARVRIKAVANPGYGFGNWTATAGEFGSVTAAETTFTMPDQAVTVTAHFEQVSPPPGVPTVTTQAATAITSYSGTVNMSYTVGNFSSVEVRFACKRLTDPAWFYSVWVPRTADGTYTEVLTDLVSQTEYEFKAQLKYNSTVIEGAVYQFTTATGTSTSLNDLLGYFGCFIATAAYGTPTAKQIDVLREFRDVVLLKSTVGSQFVVLYYQLSPPVADFIAGNEFLRTLVRELLVDPIVWIVEATGDIWRK